MRYQHSTLFAPTNTTNVRRGIRHFFKTGQNGVQAFVISFRINIDQNGVQPFVISFRINIDQNRDWILCYRQAYWTPRGVLAKSTTLQSNTSGYLGETQKFKLLLYKCSLMMNVTQ